MVKLYEGGIKKIECKTAEDIIHLKPGTYEYQTKEGNVIIKIEISKWGQKLCYTKILLMKH